MKRSSSETNCRLRMSTNNLTLHHYFYLIKYQNRLELIDNFLRHPQITAAKILSMAANVGHDPRFVKSLIKKRCWAGCIDYAKIIYKDPKIIKTITKPGCKYQFKYKYCKEVEDNEEVWKSLAVSDPKAYYWQYRYCKDVYDREEVWKALATNIDSDPKPLYLYCKDVKDREEIWKALARSTNTHASTYQYFYCRDVADREEIWKALADRRDFNAIFWQYQYYVDIKNRDEIKQALYNNPDPSAEYWTAKLLEDNNHVT